MSRLRQLPTCCVLTCSNENNHIFALGWHNDEQKMVRTFGVGRAMFGSFAQELGCGLPSRLRHLS